MASRFTHLLALAVVAVAIILFGVPTSAQPVQKSILEQQIRPIEVKDASLEQVLATIASDNEIPIGIVMANLKESGVSLKQGETKLKDFLDLLITKNPQYVWKLDRGVIHFYPVAGQDKLLETLLNTKISHFSFAEGGTESAVCRTIVTLPEIQSQMVSAGVTPLTFFMGPGTPRMGKGVSMDETNLTLIELLDRIVLRPS